MPYNKIWIHLVWATKRRKSLPISKQRANIFKHIKENAKKKGIFIDRINGHVDHVHCLCSLGVSQIIETIIQLLKGESSFWINKQKLIPEKFSWQKGYFAVSVSESAVNAVRVYIDNQEAHHNKKSFQEEYNEFLEKYGFEFIEEED